MKRLATLLGWVSGLCLSSAGCGGDVRLGGNPTSSSASSSLSTSAGSTASVASNTSTPDASPGAGVCDVLAAAGNPCVAAHSTVRALYGSYNGALYQVCKGVAVPGPSSCAGATIDIGVVAGGYADSAAQDSFCSGASCTITTIYDQSPNKNDLLPAPAGMAKNTPDNPANAADLRATVNGHPVYGILIKPGIGYRTGAAHGTATGDEPETEYMVTSQQQLSPGCCLDYGNAEADSRDDGDGTAEAVYFGNGAVWGTGSPGVRSSGPWVMADLANGLYAGWEDNQDQDISTNLPVPRDYVTAVLVGDVASQNGGRGRFALYGGDATSGALSTMYDGIRPAKPGHVPNYVPMTKQGGLVLGIGGDNSAAGGGRWYEGVMASGAASVATLGALQANIVAAQYGK